MSLLTFSGHSGPIEDPRVEDVYRIGADFCLHNPPLETNSGFVVITCNVVAPPVGQSLLPPSSRRWYLDGELLYQSGLAISNVEDLIESNFTDEYPGLIEMGIVIPNDAGEILLNIDPVNTSVPGFEAYLMAYNQIFGTWRCEFNNTLGGCAAETVIRQCGECSVLLPFGPLLSGYV